MKRIRLGTPGVIAAAVAAAALALGTSQAGEAAVATTPSAGWHSYTPPIGDGTVLSLYAPSAGDAWAVGESSTGGSLYQHFANGTAWKNAKGPNLGPLSAISGTSDKDLWVLGASSSANYNGSSWTTHPLVIPAGTAGEGDQYETSFDELYVAGPADVYAAVAVLDNTSLANEDVLEHFNGTAWSVVTNVPNVSTGNSLITQITGSGPDDIYLSAVYNNSTQSELEHFNGTAWSSVSLPGSPYDVDVEETGSGQALALGSTGGRGYAAQLSGGKWTTVSLPFANALPLGDAGGTGRAWAEMVDYNGGGAPELWQWSGGKWTQITPDNLSGGSMVGATNGGGLWSFTFGSIFTGSGSASGIELYVG